MVKSKTPKVTYFSDQAKCMLMESEEHFEAVFYSGKNNSPLQHIIRSLYSNYPGDVNRKN